MMKILRGIAWILPAVLAAVSGWCAPVDIETARRAARTELPSFFPGGWMPAGQLTLQSIDGRDAAFVFIFRRGGPGYAPAADEPADPAAFTAAARLSLSAGGRPVSGYEDELYGADRFATIYISADDTQPPVLRCFEGLPALLAKAEDATALAERRQSRAGWRIRRYLMTGLFDETYELEHPDAPEEKLLVELRSGTVLPATEAVRKAASMKPAADDELQRLSAMAWEKYRKGGAQ